MLHLARAGWLVIACEEKMNLTKSSSKCLALQLHAMENIKDPGLSIRINESFFPVVCKKRKCFLSSTMYFGSYTLDLNFRGIFYVKI